MKILLIKPRTFIESSMISSAESVLPPLGLLYIASTLIKDGHSVTVFDMDVDSTTIEDILNQLNPDWIGITATTPQFANSIEVAKKIKSIKKVPIVLGGAHASSVGAKLLNKYNCFDFIVKGEGEYTMLDLVNGKPRDLIQGLCFRSGESLIDKPPAEVDDLNKPPFPARELVSHYIYKDSPVYSRSEKHATILFSRGCIYKCIFCDYKIRGRPRFRSADNILSELKMLYAQGVRDFRVLDEFFTMNKKLTKEICKGIINSGLKISWNCQTRADALDDELIKLMKEAGCWCVQIGVETGSEEIMEKINKKLDLTKTIRVVRLLREQSIFVVAFFMIGFPFEKVSDIEQTIEFSKKLDPDMATFSIVTPYPATDLWVMSGLDDLDEKTLKDLGIYSNKNYFSGEVDTQKLFSKAVRSFYFRFKPIYRVSKEALLRGSLRRRINYIRVLVQGAKL